MRRTKESAVDELVACRTKQGTWILEPWHKALASLKRNLPCLISEHPLH